MTERKKAWSKLVRAHGVIVRIFERERGSVLYRSIMVNGKRDKVSLGHRDRALAEQQAKEFAEEFAKARLAGHMRRGHLTLAQLRDVYTLACGPMLSVMRTREVAKSFALFIAHLGAEFNVGDLAQHHVETYTHARMNGALVPENGRHVERGGVRAGVIAKEISVISTAGNWAAHKSGRKLIPANPLHGVSLPKEENKLRPVCSRERFDKLVEQADGLDGTGRFRTMLNVAWFTGRRLGSIIALRASDVLLSREAIQAALAEVGEDENKADQWNAAVRWRAEADKLGTNWIIPIPAQLATMLSAYMRERGVIGNALLFPASRDADKLLRKETAFYWFTRATKKAGLPRQARGGWHTLRRAWATQRKHLPVQDVMAAGGWKSAAALQSAYQHADPVTVKAVMEVGS